MQRRIAGSLAFSKEEWKICGARNVLGVESDHGSSERRFTVSHEQTETEPDVEGHRLSQQAEAEPDVEGHVLDASQAEAEPDVEGHVLDASQAEAEPDVEGHVMEAGQAEA
jgi:hypothetical protein